MSNFAVTILGCGVAVPTKNSNPAGFLVQAGGQKILVDAGFGIVRRLTDLGFNLQEINAVFVSHFHADHCADAFSLIFSRNCCKIYYQTKAKTVSFLGPIGAAKSFQKWRSIFWPEPGESYPVKFLEGICKTRLGQVSLETFPIKHVPYFQSVGLIIKFNGCKLVYTGDLGSNNDLSELAKKIKGADLLIIESSVKNPQPNHFTIQQVKELAQKAAVKKVLVVHIPPALIAFTKKFCQKEPNFIFGREKTKIII